MIQHKSNSALCSLLAGGLLFGLVSSTGLGNDTVPAGRYLDLEVRVHAPEQLNPLLMVGDLQFSDRVSVGEAVVTALSGTGYRLADSRHDSVRAVLASRVAIPHIRFEQKRIDSVIAAIVGAGRGYDVQVDHTARLIRIVPLAQIAPVAEKDSDSGSAPRHWRGGSRR